MSELDEFQELARKVSLRARENTMHYSLVITSESAGRVNSVAIELNKRFWKERGLE